MGLPHFLGSSPASETCPLQLPTKPSSLQHLHDEQPEHSSLLGSLQGTAVPVQ